MHHARKHVHILSMSKYIQESFYASLMESMQLLTQTQGTWTFPPRIPWLTQHCVWTVQSWNHFLTRRRSRPRLPQRAAAVFQVGPYHTRREWVGGTYEKRQNRMPLVLLKGCYRAAEDCCDWNSNRGGRGSFSRHASPVWYSRKMASG